MIKEYKIVLSSDADSVEISPRSSAHLVEGGLRGFDATGFDVTISPYASRSGGYAQKRRFSEREISLTFELDRESDSALRRKIISMLDPAKDLELYIDLGGTRRRIAVIPCDEPIFSRPTFADLTEVTLYFIAPSVFFTGSDASSVKYHDRAGLLTFPMSFFPSSGLTPGFYRIYDSAAVFNPGDGECGAVITIRAVGGDVINPIVSLGSSFIRCPMTLHDGDSLVIDTRGGKKNITLNGERCFIFDKKSSFFSLPVGETEVSVSCDGDDRHLEAILEFSPIYYGV